MVMNKKPYNSEVLTLPEIQVAIMKDPLPLTNTGWDKIIQQATEKDPTKRSLNINAKKGVKSLSVSDTEIDPLIPQQKPKQEKREKKTYFNVKTISIGVGILLFVGILVSSLSKGESADTQVTAIPEDTTTETSLPADKAEEPDLKKEESKKLPDEKTTNQNPPEVIKEEPIVTSTKLKIGQKHQGGIIFYLDDSGEHGKVCTENDLGEFDWQDAVDKCGKLNLDKYTDWYLPSKVELNILFNQRMIIGGFANLYYWSSSENDNFNAWKQNFYNGGQSYNSKDNLFCVRAIRAF
jgi:hypothetical protein